jgi:DNA-binding NarL/FixJ family response regulator
MSIKMLIVDDHVLFRQGLVSLFTEQADFEVVGESGSVGEAIEAARRLKPDLILMDFSLPDGTGVEATRAILKIRPETNIIFLTMHEDDERLFSAIRSGAKGYLVKNLPVAKLLASLRAIKQGQAPISREMASRIIDAFARSEPGKQAQEPNLIEILTTREIDVFYELTTGASNQEIAERLFISENTVKNHVHNILEKLEMSNRREVASYAFRHGIIKPGL